jgi:hypothetical protein
VCHPEQITQGIPLDAAQPHEHALIAHVVVFQIVDVGISGNQLVPALEIDADYQRVRLGGLVRGEAGEHLPGDLERR